VQPFHATLADEDDRLTARLRRLLGDPDAAEDLRQETYARAWRSAPRDLPEPALRAWLHRTAHNAGIDELRRRRRQPELHWDEETAPDVARGVGDDGPAADHDAREALAALTAHQRLLLLLRFEAGLSLRELGDVLDIGEDAARKRVARARGAFAAALRAVRDDDVRPVVALVQGRDDVEPYRRWLTAAGGRVLVLRPERPLHLAGADALVLMGSERDLHPRLYGAQRDARTVDPHLTGDLRDLAALRLALAGDVPVVGVCRGAQLLNVLLGGDLDQHVDGHDGRRAHAVDTAPGSAARRALGTPPAVHSDHHQAVRRVGAGLRVTATAPDGTVEALELPGRRLVLGTQWHPERDDGSRLAEVLVAAAATA
jgi:putative glutamine amidotransferase